MKPRRARPRTISVEQPGLADAGLAGQEEQLPGAGGRLAQPPVGQREQVVAADHDGQTRTPAGQGTGMAVI